mmetsp:Transcript_26068/g.42608  ORF Transcript_26068/g.42608 Transcript_26068/m.42608 type:complete len:334 (+) Transcript_26068:74-1075(+)
MPPVLASRGPSWAELAGGAALLCGLVAVGDAVRQRALARRSNNRQSQRRVLQAPRDTRPADVPVVSSRWRLDGCRVLITGSTKGIGLAAAEDFLQHGASVFLVARGAEDVTSTMSRLVESFKADGRVHGLAADVSTETGRAALVHAVSAVQGWEEGLDCVVNNAGTNVRKSALEATDEEYSSIMQTNVASVWFLSKSLQPLLARSSRPCIVNVSSVAGVTSTGSGGIYAMSKAAVVQLTKTLACEWAQYGIRVNCVAPWVTRTPMLAAAIEKNPSSIQKNCEWTPLHRPAEPEEISAAILFFALPCASFITGQTLCVDGGLLANGFAGPCVEG